MRKKSRVRHGSKTKRTVILLAIGAPVLTLGLSLAAAKLVLGGVVKQEQLEILACTIAGLTALLISFFAARSAESNRFLWGMLTAAGYLCALLMGNLLFFGEGYGRVLPILLSCMCGGFLGTLLAALKRRKYA